MTTSTSTTTPRRGSADRKQRELHLLEAAEDAFVTHGYHNASMDLIATLAGVSKPIVYQYFPGKLQLFQELVQRRSDELLARLVPSLQESMSAQERISVAIREFFAYVEEEERSFLLLADSGDRNGPPLADDQKSPVVAFTDLISPLITDHSGRSDEEGRLIGRALSTMCVAVGVEWLQGGRQTPRADLVRDVSDVAWNGLQRRLGPVTPAK